MTKKRTPRKAHNKRANAAKRQANSLAPSPESFDLQAALQQASKLFNKGLYPETESLCKKILAVAPDNIQALYGIGKVAHLTGRFDDAAQCFEKIIKILPDNAEAYSSLGLILRDSGKEEEAVLAFRKAIALNPDITETYVNLGLVLYELGKSEEAIDCYRKALSINSLSFEAHFNLSLAYLGKNLLDEALQSLQNAVENSPGNSRVSDALIKLLNNYMPKIETNCSYIKAQNSLQEISTEYTSSRMIDDETVRQIYQQCHNILSLHKLAIKTNESQLYRGQQTTPTNCHRHKKVFETFNIIPEHCFDCYKVTLEPRTVMELFKLLLVFDRLKLPNNNSRKCIVEIRPGISGTYKGFIYCKSLDEAKEILDIIQPIIDEKSAKGMPIFVKRGCSEFSLAYPAYGQITDNKIQQMTYNEEWRKYEAQIDKNLLKHADDNPNDLTHDHSGFTLLDALVMRQWLEYAATIGDATYLDISELTLPTSSH